MSEEPGSEAERGPRIIDLPELVESLPQESRSLFHRIFLAGRYAGRLIVPPAMGQWVRNQFGSVEAVESQTILKVTNRITLEGALYNPIRASRPMPAQTPGDLLDAINRTAGDPFCRPETGTPEDVFGRVEGSHSVTASNIAKYDAFHGLVIFDHHNPLVLSEAGVTDYLTVGRQWAEKVLQVDPSAVYFFFMWNAVWKSGASIIHGHAQVACTHDIHYARVERLRRAALEYRQEAGSDYFADLVGVHRALGLTLDYQGITILASLAPVREREVLILAPGPGGAFPAALYRVLDSFISHQGVTSFNAAIYMPPLRPTSEDWTGFPHLAQVVDRGDPMNRTNDVGAMELYASPVISSDPFQVIEALRVRFAQG